MNKRFEKWLTIVALGSWVTSMGALVAIEVASTQPASDQSLPSESQAIRLPRRDSPFASVLDSQFYQQLKRSDTLASLEPERGHWLDRSLVSREILNRDFSGLDLKNQKSGSSSEEPLADRKLGAVWLIAQTGAWQSRSPRK